MPNIPHGPPFRLIDRVLHAEPERGQLVALRRLTAADALWPADQNLPEHAVSSLPPALPPALAAELPRPLIIEALCQAAACLNALVLAPAADRSPPHRGYLVAISGFRFPHSAQHTPPLPGDSLLLWVTQKESRGALVAFEARATLHRGACDPESLRTAIQNQRQNPIQDPRQAPDSDVDPKTPGAAKSRAGAVGDREEGAELLAAGRLLFAVTMA